MMVLQRFTRQGASALKQCASLGCYRPSLVPPHAQPKLVSSWFTAPRSIHTTRPYLKDDVGTGVDPGYSPPSSNTKEKELGSSSQDGRVPSHATDPFPLPFDPRLQGLDLSSTSQSAGLKGARAESFEGAPPSAGEAIDVEAKDGETPVPIRLPGRGPEDEDRETRIARLIYQARKRGTLETDLLLSTFAQQHLHRMPDIEVLEFDILLDEPDWDLFYWLTERKPVPERWRASFETEGRLGWRLRKHTKNENKEVRRMPAL